MRKLVIGVLAATAIAGSAVAWNAVAVAAGDPPSPERMQRMMDDHAAMLDAKLAGLKAGLKLTAEQEKNWAPFEAAIRDAVKGRQEAMRKMMETMRAASDEPSPITHLEMMAERMTQGAASLRSIAAAAKPLYDSLDDGQKRHFRQIGHMMMAGGHGEHMGMMGPGMMGMGGHHLGPMGGEGMHPPGDDQ